VKAVLTDERKLYYPAFSESSVNRQWDRFIFWDNSTFSFAVDGPVSVYRPRGKFYNSHYVLTSTHAHLSVHCWGWISHKGAGILHPIEEHPDGLQYKHILKHVMVPSVRVLYPDGLIQYQQDHSSVNDSHVV
jgi:hypothetical protein